MNHSTITLSFGMLQDGSSLEDLLDRFLKMSHSDLLDLMAERLGKDREQLRTYNVEKDARQFLRALRRDVNLSSWYSNKALKIRYWKGLSRYSWSAEIRGSTNNLARSLIFFWDELTRLTWASPLIITETNEGWEPAVSVTVIEYDHKNNRARLLGGMAEPKEIEKP